MLEQWANQGSREGSPLGSEHFLPPGDRSVRQSRSRKSAQDAKWNFCLTADMALDGRNQLWVADLTYVTVLAGFVYVAVILDAWSCKVVGYAIGRSLDARLTLAALKAAIERRRDLPRMLRSRSLCLAICGPEPGYRFRPSLWRGAPRLPSRRWPLLEPEKHSDFDDASALRTALHLLSIPVVGALLPTQPSDSETALRAGNDCRSTAQALCASFRPSRRKQGFESPRARSTQRSTKLLACLSWIASGSYALRQVVGEALTRPFEFEAAISVHEGVQPPAQRGASDEIADRSQVAKRPSSMRSLRAGPSSSAR